jgi:cytochrome b subunit of formate dehydrogenase
LEQVVNVIGRCLQFVLLLSLLVGLAAQSTDKQQSAPAGQGSVSSASAPDNDLCLSCHTDVGDKVKHNVHASVSCQSCHQKHEEYPHPDGIAKPSCATCHANMATDYAHSVHGQAMKSGNLAAPDCATCHGKAHEIERTNTQAFRSAVPELCGSCHLDIVTEYQDSVHGQAVKNGFMQAPVCTDCHGEHLILGPKDAASSVNATHIRNTCAGCHNSVQLTRRFGLPSDRIVSFDASYHGLASKAGGESAANCASCHGVHNIRASSDPKSTVHPNNLAKTCGKCHTGAGTRFAIGQVHTMSGHSESAGVRWVRRFYLAVIPLTIGLMFAHNFGDWLRKLMRLRARSQYRAPDTADFATAPLRTMKFERIQHATLAISFIVLAYTGFALKYPDQGWARPALLWESSHSMRGLIHRIASIVFMTAAVAHVLSLIFSKKLRDHWMSLLPKWNDLREAISNFAYNLGLTRRVPMRSSHSYIEKAEYWALVWGSMIMVVTGVLLWGTNLALQWMPKWVLDVATSIHFYEAVLASLAILVWHFYFVIFDPDVYPMDTAWLTGKSPRKEPSQDAQS